MSEYYLSHLEQLEAESIVAHLHRIKQRAHVLVTACHHVLPLHRQACIPPREALVAHANPTDRQALNAPRMRGVSVFPKYTQKKTPAARVAILLIYGIT